MINLLRRKVVRPPDFTYCRYHNDIIGSSNTTEIMNYCREHSIIYITTMDFLVEAFKCGLMNEAACDEFIYKVKLKGSRLPCDTIAEYLDRV